MAFFLAGLNTNSNAHRLSRPLDHICNKSAAGSLLEFELTVVFQLSIASLIDMCCTSHNIESFCQKLKIQNLELHYFLAAK